MSEGYYYSTKHFLLGFPAAYRNWRADSHCKLLHGRNWSFKIFFHAESLDIRNWCVDFGSLKSLKAQLEELFDHTVLLDVQDPFLEDFQELEKKGALKITIMPDGVSCEAIARIVYELGDTWLQDNGYKPRCTITSVEVYEDAANGAIYVPSNPVLVALSGISDEEYHVKLS